MTGTGAADLVAHLVNDQPVPAALVAEVDPVELAALTINLLGWPQVQGSGVSRAVEATHGGGSGVAAVAVSDDRLRAIRFLLALATGSGDVVDLAAEVDTLTLGFLCVQVMGWPAVSEPVPWLDRLMLAEVERIEGA